MSYTPTSWSTGDTITASALNKIENGIANASGSVARVLVNFNDGGISGSVVCFVAYAQYTQGRYSIESNMLEFYGTAPYRGRFYVPVPLPPANDSFKAYILFSEVLDSISGYTITGNISQTKITANAKYGPNSWESVPYYGFEVTGDGQVDVFYVD